MNPSPDMSGLSPPWQPGQSGNPGGRPKTKPFRDALKRAVDAAGDDTAKLDRVAIALYAKALEGDVAAIRELADRLDGKVAQAHIGGDDDEPAIKHKIERIETYIVDPKERDSTGV